MKHCIAVLFCENSDGLNQYELMFIRTSLRPKAFKNNSGAEHELYYP